MTWVCGDCNTKWHAAVPSCIFCLTTEISSLKAERDVMLLDDDVSWRSRAFTAEADLARANGVLEMFAIDASLLLDTLPAELPHLFQKMSAQAVNERISEAWELLGERT